MSVTPFYLSVESLKDTQIAHGFFGRQGGVSTGLLVSLNTGYGTEDSRDNIDENRRRIAIALGATRIASVYQVHGASVVTIGADHDFNSRPEADAMVTNLPGIALGILTADCVPILFADPTAGVIGAAHAGWKGALAGVIQNTLDAMTALGADITNIHAAIGPAIQQRSYEVSDDLRQRFLAQYSTNERFFTANANDKFQFDLPGYVAAQLKSAGLRPIENLGVDTYSDPECWFSYRRATHNTETDYGRQLSAICLKA